MAHAVNQKAMNLYFWISLYLLAPLTAALSLFVQMTFEPGMIFRKYYAWITYWFWFKPRISRYRKYVSIEVIRKNVNPKTRLGVTKWHGEFYIIPAKWYSWFYKPLGGCVYCNGTWIAIIVYSILYFINVDQAIYLKIVGLFLFIGLNYICIEILSKLKK